MIIRNFTAVLTVALGDFLDDFEYLRVRPGGHADLERFVLRGGDAGKRQGDGKPGDQIADKHGLHSFCWVNKYKSSTNDSSNETAENAQHAALKNVFTDD